MDSLDKLSDDELRRRLLQYGFPNYPVTSTSRKVLIKKLRNHIDGQKPHLRREITYATRYSSDEENTPDSATKSPIRRGRSTISSKDNISMNTNNTLKMQPPPSLKPSVKSISTSPSLTKRNLTSYSTITSTASPTAYYTNNNNTSIYNNENNNRPIQNKSSVFVPPPIVHSDSDDDSDYYAPASEKKKTINPTNRYSYSTSNTSDNSKSNISSSSITTRNSTFNNNNNTDVHDFGYNNYNMASSMNIPTTITPPQSPTINLRNRETITNGYTNTNDTPPPQSLNTDFTKRLLSFRGSTTESPMKKHDHQLSYNLTNQSTPLQPYGGRFINYQSSIASRNVNNNNNNSIVYQSDPLSSTNDDYLKRRKQPSTIQTTFKYLSNKFDELYRYNQTLVPCILLSGLIIFFVLVTFMYLTIKPDLASTLNAKTTTYTLCEKLSSNYQNTMNDDNEHFNNIILSTNVAAATITCIEKYELEDALNALVLIASELQKRIEIYKCKGGSKIGGKSSDAINTYVMSAREIIKNYLIDKHPNLRITTAMRILHNIEYLIEQNPQWLINHCDSNGNQLTFEQVLNLRDTQGNSIAILHPRLPFSCYVYNKLQTFFIIVGCVGLIVALFYIIIIFYRFVRHWQLVKKERFDNLITDIINYLTEQSTANRTSGNSHPTLIVLNHLRDKLIPPANRYDMETTWQRAIQFLESNDSRIQFEIGNRNGEDCRMIRWVDTAPPSHLNASNTNTIKSNAAVNVMQSYLNTRGPIKKWQSPAFDKSNKIKDPPTPCLKIRQMFDKYEASNPALPNMIRDAILEKVGSECKIYDINLDYTSCCVYVNCESIIDAGRVHDEINGWWFDNRLVSIKFVRMNRYLERFPHASFGPYYLRPSNANNLSMTSIVNNNNNNNNNNSNINKNEYNYNRNEMEYQNNEDADGDDDNDDDDDDGGDEEISGIINRSGVDIRRSGSIERRYKYT